MLTSELTKRIPDFLSSVEQLCAVPPSLPADPEGAKAPLSSPAPYYVAQYVPGERLVLATQPLLPGSASAPCRPLRRRSRARCRNDHRPHRERRVRFQLRSRSTGSAQASSASATASTGRSCSSGPRTFCACSSSIRAGHSSRTTRSLRQAVNFAVDRKALLTRELGPLAGTSTDQLPVRRPSPDTGTSASTRSTAPTYARRARLPRATREPGKPFSIHCRAHADVAQAQVLQQNLKAIGLAVEITQFPRPCSSRSWRRREAIRHRSRRLELTHRILRGSPDLRRTHDRTGGPTSELVLFQLTEVQPTLRQASRLTGDER